MIICYELCADIILQMEVMPSLFATQMLSLTCEDDEIVDEKTEFKSLLGDVQFSIESSKIENDLVCKKHKSDS